MASTTLFAPSVRAVQPAFTYSSGSGTAKVYFTLNYNTIDQVQKIRYSLIDPNKSATDGGNSMITDATTKEVSATQLPNGEYYFDIVFNPTEFKFLTVNQFYQVQIELYDGGDWSLPSTVSLIRPIAPIAAGYPKLRVSDNRKTLLGQIAYQDGSTIESIARVKYVIKQKEGEEVVKTVDTKTVTNFLGTRFEVPINYTFNEALKYQIDVELTTKHGKIITDSIVLDAADIASQDAIEAQAELLLQSGEVELKFLIPNGATGSEVNLFIERASEFSNYSCWQRVATIESPQAQTIKWRDSFIEARTKYKYRLKIGTDVYPLKFSQPGKDPIEELCIEYDDIFLCDTDAMLALRYNVKLSGYKWVTQSSIMNTLGGKYPFIRKNGDQFYRTFNLSGLIYLDYDHNSNIVDSLSRIGEGQKITAASLPVDECALYLSQEKALEYGSDPSKRKYLEKRMRELALQFLSNGSVKVFRSGQEESMIVFLSNVTFTPDVISGRKYYEFSATVTEICEATEENIVKYGFGNKFADIIYTWKYILSSNRTVGSDNIPGTFKAYVNASEILASGSGIKLHAKTVTKE